MCQCCALNVKQVVMFQLNVLDKNRQFHDDVTVEFTALL